MGTGVLVRKLLKATLCIFALGASLVTSVAIADDYVLGPGDRLRLKILEWRPGRGETYDWPGLSGEFVVGSGGEISLPMLGRVEASGHTTAELASTIGALLQQEVGLVRKLQTSVEVAQHRPFYVSGGVEKPGEYPYRPGMTVVEAVSVAGGIYRRPDAENGFQREAIQARGAEGALASERIGLLATQARLQAEVEAANEVQFPTELAGSQGDARVAAATKEQVMLFKSRKDSLESQVVGLDQIKGLYTAEIATLEGKIQSIAHQASLNKTELDGIAALLSKGLTTAPRKLALQQNAAQFESTRLDLELSVVRAKQAISKAERDKSEAVNARRNEALVDLEQTRTKIGQNDENLATARKLARQAETMLMRRASGSDRPSAASFEIIHHGVGQPVRASETDFISPGDVVRVSEPGLTALAN